MEGGSRVEYAGPIPVMQNTRFRITAYKDGMAFDSYSERLNLNVTVANSTDPSPDNPGGGATDPENPGGGTINPDNPGGGVGGNGSGSGSGNGDSSVNGGSDDAAAVVLRSLRAAAQQALWRRRRHMLQRMMLLSGGLRRLLQLWRAWWRWPVLPLASVNVNGAGLRRFVILPSKESRAGAALARFCSDANACRKRSRRLPKR